MFTFIGKFFITSCEIVLGVFLFTLAIVTGDPTLFFIWGALTIIIAALWTADRRSK